MKNTHENYLKLTLLSKRNTLQELQVEHRIHMALHSEKQEHLSKDIDSIERQLKEVDVENSKTQ